MTNEYLEKYRKDLEKISGKIVDVLKDDFIGFYVFGSIVMRAWNPKSSDIDFFVVTQTPLTADEKNSLEKIHDEFAQTEFGQRLEGDYIDVDALRNKRFDSMIARVKDGKFEAEYPCQISADNVLNLIRDGVCIQGEKIKNLRLNVSEEEFIEAVYSMLVEDAEEINGTNNFKDLHYLLVDILRCIYSLATKKLPTKQAAIEFAKDLLGKELYQNMIERGGGKIDEFSIDKRKLHQIAIYGMSLKK